MGKVILLVGPHGVGKTSIIEYARKQGDFIVYDGFKISSNQYNLNDINDFLKYQHEYLKIASDISNKIHNDKLPGIVLRSIEECSFYYYSKPDSNLFMNYYFECVKENKYMGADIFIYLDATYDVLQRRCNGDKNRDMKKTCEWYEKKYADYERYWKNYSGSIVLDTTRDSVQEIYQKIKEICDEGSICVEK